MTLQQAIAITSVKGTNFEMRWSAKSLMLLKVSQLGFVCSHEMSFKNNQEQSLLPGIPLTGKKGEKTEFMAKKQNCFLYQLRNTVSTNNEFC